MITVEKIMALRPCGKFSEESVRVLVGNGLREGAALAVLLSLTQDDARWVLSRLMNRETLVIWAKGAASRAREYAAAAASASDASYAAYASASDASYAAYAAASAADDAAAYAADDAAAYAAAYAADDAAAYAAYAAASASAYAAAAYAAYAAADADADEHKLSCVLGLELLAEQARKEAA